MQVIRSVGVLSFAKVMGALYGALGLLFIPFLAIAGLAGALSGRQNGGVLAGVGLIVLGLILPVIYGGMGFVMGALMAWVYNLMAGWTGGIQIQLQGPLPVQERIQSA